MNGRLTIAVAAALAAGGFAYSVGTPAWAEDKPGAPAAYDANAAATEAPKIILPAGIKLKDKATEEDRTGALRTLHSLTEAALTKNGLDDVVERLVDQDRNRIGADKFTEQKFDDLNTQVEAIRNAWKAKYGSDFNVENEALAKVVTVAGEIEDPAALAGAWPVPAIPDAAEAVTAAAKDPAARAAPGDEDANLEKGRDIAVGAIPASHGLPTVNVSMIQELGGYRVDIPNTITGQQLHDSLLKCLTEMNEAQAKWPAEVRDAELMVAHHIALGVYGVEEDAARAVKASDAAKDLAK